jgi:hypothetical protein
MAKKKFDYGTFKKEAAEHLKNGRSMLVKYVVFIPLFKEFSYYSYLSYEKANYLVSLILKSTDSAFAIKFYIL